MVVRDVDSDDGGVGQSVFLRKEQGADETQEDAAANEAREEDDAIEQEAFLLFAPFLFSFFSFPSFRGGRFRLYFRTHQTFGACSFLSQRAKVIKKF